MNKILFGSAMLISLTTGDNLYAEFSDQAYLNSLENVTNLVRERKDEACNQVTYMEKQAATITASRFHENLQAWTTVCQRRKGILVDLKSSKKDKQLTALKRIIKDPAVEKIVKAEQDKIDHATSINPGHEMYPLHGTIVF